MNKDIKVTFYSNFLLHHQTPFCEAMVSRIGKNFHYVATTAIPAERAQMGYHDYTKESYAVNSYESEELYNYALELGRDSDVVILGDAPDVFIEERLKSGKLTFRYNERFFKQGKIRLLDPRVLIARYKNDIRYRKKNLHMLCASAYTAPDCRFIFSYPNRTYKWGYFTELKEYSDIEKMIDEKQTNSILWVSRLIKLKHPEIPIRVAKTLKEKNIPFTMDMVGEGVLLEKVKKLIAKYDLQGYIKLHGFMSPEMVREYMEKADLFLFTSDHNEGWGAVLTESMNSACAVVACKEIGSVPYLIEDGENGLIYNRRKKKDIVNKVISILENKDYKRKLQLNAYNTLRTTWNADVAAERFLNLVEDIQNGQEIRYKSGPCSRD